MRIELITPLHRATARDYFARMRPGKSRRMEIAMTYGRDYWDGDREHGYGGYRYDGRWRPVAAALIARYGLTSGSSVLDLGCGKAHLLAELKALLPGLRVVGGDVSDYALANAHESVRDELILLDLRQAPLPFSDREFDLVLSLNTLHNLPLSALLGALREIERVGVSKYVVVESYRDAEELTNLQCWALTCASFFDADEWPRVFELAGFHGDHELIFFEGVCEGARGSDLQQP